MNFELARRNMVVHQLEQRGINDPRVLEAMEWVRRELFVPAALVDKAYDDCALPIGLDQTISQPYTVAFMCQAALLSPNDKVLEIGTGSGYAAAVLSLLAREIHTVERHQEFAEMARERLAKLDYANVSVHRADGALGLPEEAPFDAILVTAGAAALPELYLDQLSVGGRLVIPVGPPAQQNLYRYTSQSNQWNREDLGGFAFVPLVEGEPRH